MPEFRRPALAWIVAAVAVVALAGLSPSWAADSDLEARARKIEGKLMAPCCKANTVAEHYSPAALKVRDEVREMLAAGQSEQEILDHYVAKYGDQILAAPAPHGFNLVAYLVPFLLLLAGTGVMVLITRRWTRTHNRESPPEPETAAIEPEYAERLRRELHEFDSPT